jgi:hypothetical protein
VRSGQYPAAHGGHAGGDLALRVQSQPVLFILLLLYNLYYYLLLYTTFLSIFII